MSCKGKQNSVFAHYGQNFYHQLKNIREYLTERLEDSNKINYHYTNNNSQNVDYINYGRNNYGNGQCNNYSNYRQNHHNNVNYYEIYPDYGNYRYTDYSNNWGHGEDNNNQMIDHDKNNNNDEDEWF